MNKTKENYWFYIEPYVHISVLKNWAMLYNSLTGEIHEYRDAPEILKSIDRLRSPKNLRVIRLTEDDLKNPKISGFVETMRESFMGDLIETSHSKRKPVLMTPIPKIQKDVKYLKNSKTRSVGENMMRYLSEISIYINEKCSQECAICKDAYKQFPCCTARNKKGAEPALEKIKDLIEQTKGSGIANVNILGGDIFAYTQITGLLDYLETMNFQSCFYLHYLNAGIHIDRLNELASGSTFLKIPVTFPIQEEILARVIETTRRIGIKTEIIFIITDESEIEAAETIASSYSIETFSFQPYFTGNNITMFEDNIYITREDLTEANPTLKEIYARKKINPHHFGRLTIMPNGHIYANIDTPSLGTLGKNSIYEIIYREMLDGKSWRKTRRSVLPCKQCVFNCLCPPLSNLNTTLKKNNLCHIM